MALQHTWNRGDILYMLSKHSGHVLLVIVYSLTQGCLSRIRAATSAVQLTLNLCNAAYSIQHDRILNIPRWYMNIAMSNDISESSESTFRSYTPALAKAYAAGRGSYHENLFNTIIDNHKSTGGSMQVLLDIGCGPGNSTRPLARHFDSAFGIDPSPEMINTARNLSAAPDTASGKSIIFSVGKAEEMDGPFRETEHGVDLLTSGTAVCTLRTLGPSDLV